MPLALLDLGQLSLWIASGDTVTWRSNFVKVGSTPSRESTESQQFIEVSCGNVGLQAVQIVVIDGALNLWHTLLDSKGIWQPDFRSIADQSAGGADSAEGYRRVSCAGAADALHVIGVSHDAGQLWHTFRANSGGWQGRFGLVGSQSAGGPARFADVACGSSDGQALQVVGLGTDGKLWHTYRAAGGAWQPAFAAVGNQSAGGPSGFAGVAATGAQGVLHVVAVGSDQQLWHTTRGDNSVWQPTFGAIGPQSSGGPGAYLAAACCIDDNWNLQVIGVGTDGKLYRTRRNVDGTWAPAFERVQSQVSGGPGFSMRAAIVRAAAHTFPWSG